MKKCALHAPNGAGCTRGLCTLERSISLLEESNVPSVECTRKYEPVNRVLYTEVLTDLKKKGCSPRPYTL